MGAGVVGFDVGFNDTVGIDEVGLDVGFLELIDVVGDYESDRQGERMCLRELISKFKQHN